MRGGLVGRPVGEILSDRWTSRRSPSRPPRHPHLAHADLDRQPGLEHLDSVPHGSVQSPTERVGRAVGRPGQLQLDDDAVGAGGSEGHDAGVGPEILPNRGNTE